MSGHPPGRRSSAPPTSPASSWGRSGRSVTCSTGSRWSPRRWTMDLAEKASQTADAVKQLKTNWVASEPDNADIKIQLYFWREDALRSEEHTSELQSLRHLVCRLLL